MMHKQGRYECGLGGNGGAVDGLPTAVIAGILLASIDLSAMHSPLVWDHGNWTHRG